MNERTAAQLRRLPMGWPKWALVRGQRKRIPSLPKKELPVAANTTKYRERPMEKTNDGSDFAIFSEILNPSHAIPAAKSPATRMYRECLPADNSINTGPSEIILNKSPRLCHRAMDASAQSRWLLGSGEGTRTESRVPAAAIGARTGGERALAEATGTSAAS